VMVMAGKGTDVLPQPRSDQVRLRSRPSVALPAVMAAEGVAFAALLGLDGSAVWRMALVRAIPGWWRLLATRTAVLGQAAVLARHGYGALLLDGRGHGLSGGHAMDFGWWGDRDIAAAISFLTRQPGVHAGKIALVGESMGGEQALAAMGAGNEPGTTAGAAAANGARIPGTDDLCRELR
jgi:fermentation-respiration switch protein FrsA (DUF1100 family)